MRHQLAVDVALAHPPCDQLAVLRAEVDDRDRVPFGEWGVGRGEWGCPFLRRLCLSYLQVCADLDVIRGCYSMCLARLPHSSLPTPDSSLPAQLPALALCLDRRCDDHLRLVVGLSLSPSLVPQLSPGM